MTTLRDMVLVKLQDIAGDIFAPNEVDQGISEALAEYSRRNPLEGYAELQTIAGSKKVDISSLEAYLLAGYSSDSFFQCCEGRSSVEYPTGSDPEDYRNFHVLTSGYIVMDISSSLQSQGKRLISFTGKPGPRLHCLRRIITLWQTWLPL